MKKNSKFCLKKQGNYNNFMQKEAMYNFPR